LSLRRCEPPAGWRATLVESLTLPLKPCGASGRPLPLRRAQPFIIVYRIFRPHEAKAP
jgi:hypothetical protein